MAGTAPPNLRIRWREINVWLTDTQNKVRHLSTSKTGSGLRTGGPAADISRNHEWQAAWCEALGASIRLDRALWAAAGVEQEKRLSSADDPFTDTFCVHLGDKTGRITSEDAWKLLGVDAGRRTPELKRRFGAALKALGWRPVTIKVEAGKHSARVQGYGTGNVWGQDASRRIAVMLRREGMPEPRRAMGGLYFLPAQLQCLQRREGVQNPQGGDYADDGPENFGP